MDPLTFSFVCAFPGISSSGIMRKGIKNLLQDWICPFGENLSQILHIDICQYIRNEKYKGTQDVLAQVVSYAASCAVFDEYRKRLDVNYLCAYSVGIFGALYAAGSISFTNGVSNLVRLDELIGKSCGKDGSRFMAVVIGLNRDEVAADCHGFEVINQNSDTGLVITGTAANIKDVEISLMSRGAIYFRPLPVRYPYHSSELACCQDQWVEQIRQGNIADPVIPIISSTSGRILKSSEDCFEELKNNYCSSFSWLHLLNMLWDMGARDIYECGIGRDLARIGKYSGVAHKYHHYV